MKKNQPSRVEEAGVARVVPAVGVEGVLALGLVEPLHQGVAADADLALGRPGARRRRCRGR